MAQCTAKSKRSGERCKNNAMKGKKVCRFHGGKSKGGPTGNKNTLKTGQYETITPATMYQHEIELAYSISLDPIKTLEGELVTLQIRKMRIMEKMKKVLDGEQLSGAKMLGKKGDHGLVYPKMVTTGSMIVTTFEGNGEDQKQKSKSLAIQSESHGKIYLDLEQALASVQRDIGKAVERLVKMKSLVGDDADRQPISKIQIEVIGKDANQSDTTTS